MEDSSNSSDSCSSDYVSITLKREQAQRIQNVIGSLFGRANLEVNITALKRDLDDLQCRIWHAINDPVVVDKEG